MKRSRYQPVKLSVSGSGSSAVASATGTGNSTQPDLSMRTRNLYRSYLNYSLGNPFESNYDIVSKRKNSELVSDSTYRFNRANSSMSLLSHSLEFKKFSASAETPLVGNKRLAESEATTQLSVVLKPVLDSGSRSNGTDEGKSRRVGTARMSLKKNSDRNSVRASTATNQFLNFRNDDSKGFSNHRSIELVYIVGSKVCQQTGMRKKQKRPRLVRELKTKRTKPSRNLC